ncbi:acyl-CoA dehydrogenase family protein [Castellaniella sp. WN]
MNPRLGVSEDDLEIAAAIGRYAAAEIAPLAAELDEQARSATCHVPGLAALGVMGMNLPERWGGVGVSPAALVLAIAEIARHCAATSSMIGAHYLATDSILIGGDDALRAQYLPRAARGDILGAFALTEPRAGSNPADMGTQAHREGDQYHLSGVKHFISNAGEADFIVVYAKTDPLAGSRGISAFIVDRGASGLQVSRPEKLMGIRGGHAFEVALDCRVPATHRLGEEGSGFRTAMKVLDNSRLDVAATSLGVSEAALAAATSWSRERLIDGQPLAGKQGIQWMLADMKLRLEAAWALTLQATHKRGQGEGFSMESAMAKLYASEAAGFITDHALQIHGGYGYTRDLPLERYARDARILRIYEGSSEIQRTIIARRLLAA